MRGPDIAERFRAAVHEFERTLNEGRTSLQNAEDARARLETEREQLLLRLSEVYLPELGQAAVDGLRSALPGIHTRVEMLLREKSEEQRRLADTLDQQGRERSRLDAALDDLTERVEHLAQERDRLTDTVATAIEARPAPRGARAAGSPQCPARAALPRTNPPVAKIIWRSQLCAAARYTFP